MKNLKVETGIHVALPDNLVGILMPVLDIEMLKHKSQKTIIGIQKLCFNFVNASFNKMFIFKESDLLGFLMLINTKEKKYIYYFIEYHYPIFIN